MVEVLITGAVVAAAAAAFSRRSGPLTLAATQVRNGFDTPSVDLPCPWCSGPTLEDDPHCTTCGQRFG